jgi:hypothetical protein
VLDETEVGMGEEDERLTGTRAGLLRAFDVLGVTARGGVTGA